MCKEAAMKRRSMRRNSGEDGKGEKELVVMSEAGEREQL